MENPEHGKTKGAIISLEMPWREGTAVRSAGREDILRLLAPLDVAPECDVMYLDLTEFPKRPDYPICLEVVVYVIPRSDKRVVIPLHRCEAVPEFGDIRVPLAPFAFRSQEAQFKPKAAVRHGLVIDGPNELIFTGPGAAKLYAGATGSLKDISSDEGRIVVTMKPSGATVPIIVDEPLRKFTEEGFLPTWRRSRRK